MDGAAKVQRSDRRDDVAITRRVARAASKIGLGLGVSVGILGSALVLGAIPVPTGQAVVAAQATDVTVHIVSNGFHTDIVLPADGGTLATLGLDPADFPVDHALVQGWAIGWGSRTAYTSLRAVSDLSPAIIAEAIAFDETVMHVAPVGALGEGEGIYRLRLSAERYDALLASVEAGFAKGDRNALAGITQGFGDRFYAGAGRFTAWFGCNAWVARRLREAGVPVGLWTPTAQSLTYGLDRIAGGSQE